MPIGLNDKVNWIVHQERNGEDIHLWVNKDSRLAQFHWYPSPEAFTKSGARHFWGVTCGMNEETRDHVVDQIDLSIADDIDPEHDPEHDQLG